MATSRNVGCFLRLPGKSMLLCFNESQQTIALFAACKYSNILNFVLYLKDMCSRYWRSGIAGANIAILKRR